MNYFTTIAQTLLTASSPSILGSGRERDAHSSVALVISDLIHSDLLASAGPLWWPVFVLIHDIVAGLYVNWRMNRSARPPQASMRHAVGEAQ